MSNSDKKSKGKKNQASDATLPVIKGLVRMTEDVLHSRCEGCPLAEYSGDGDEVVDCKVGELGSIHCPGPANAVA